jgi:hypothetical protein
VGSTPAVAAPVAEAAVPSIDEVKHLLIEELRNIETTWVFARPFPFPDCTSTDIFLPDARLGHPG